MTERTRRLLAPLVLAAAVAMAACGAEPSARADLAAHAQAARLPADLQAGDVTIRASLAPTAALAPAIAQRYGVQPDRGVQLLLVGVRSGPADDEASLAARVGARARDLRGVWQQVPMHEVRSDGFIDYAGGVRVSPPDTLAVEVTVRLPGADAPLVLRFNRDILPP